MTEYQKAGDKSQAAAAPAADSPLQLWAQNNVFGPGASSPTHEIGKPAENSDKPSSQDRQSLPADASQKPSSDTNQKVTSDTSSMPKESAVHRMLADFGLVGTDKPVTAADKANAFIKEAGHQAYTSADAAYTTVTNTLADNPSLRHKLTDAKGNITTESVEQMKKLEQGSEVLAAGSRHPIKQELTQDEKKAFKNVESHEGAIGGGIAAAGVGAAASDKIAKMMVDDPTIKHDDLAKAIHAAIEAAARDAAKQQGKTQGDHTTPVTPGFGKPSDVHRVGQDNTPRHTRATSIAPLDQDHFADVSKRVLAKLDTKHDGMVTKDQLAKAMQDPSFKGEEAQALAAMYKNFDQLHNLSHHENIWNTASITPADLDKFQTIRKDVMQKQAEAGKMNFWAQGNMQKFMQPGSDHLTKDDIEKALNNPKVSKNDKDMLQLVKKHFGDIDSWYDFNGSGITVKDLSDYSTKSVWENKDSKMVSGVYTMCYEVSHFGQQAGTNYDLYASRDPLKSITPDAIKQGFIGDCYYESTVASIAKSNPALIRDMIKDNHNGTYTVTFPGAKNEPITVSAPTEAELGVYNHGSSQGAWASVLEKAYGKYRDNHAWIGSNTPQEGADGGGLATGVIELMTGKDASTHYLSFNSKEATAKYIEDAVKNHKPICAGISGDLFTILGIGDGRTDDKYYKWHEYSITGFEPDGKGGGTVLVRNPWGDNSDSYSGDMRVPLDVFMKNFSDISVQN